MSKLGGDAVLSTWAVSEPAFVEGEGRAENRSSPVNRLLQNRFLQGAGTVIICAGAFSGFRDGLDSGAFKLPLVGESVTQAANPVVYNGLLGLSAAVFLVFLIGGCFTFVKEMKEGKEVAPGMRSRI